MPKFPISLILFPACFDFGRIFTHKKTNLKKVKNGALEEKVESYQISQNHAACQKRVKIRFITNGQINSK